MRNVLRTTMKDMTLAPGTNLDELIDRTMNAQADTLSKINMTTAEGKKEVEFILQGMNSVVDEYFHTEENTPVEIADEITENVEDNLEDNGFDAGDFGFDLRDIVNDTMDAVEASTD